MALILTVLGFMWWWPIGLLILGFLIARGKFGCFRHPIYVGDGTMPDWEHGSDRWERKMARMQEKMERMRARMDRVRSPSDWFGPTSSGNRAFDDYRSETLKRSKSITTAWRRRAGLRSFPWPLLSAWQCRGPGRPRSP